MSYQQKQQSSNESMELPQIAHVKRITGTSTASVTSAVATAAVTPEVTGGVVARSHNRQMWQQMTRTVAHYKRLEQIGLGTYGQVYRAECLDTGRTVAMKKMRIMTGRGFQGMPLQLIREIKILKQLQHPNLLQMIEVVTSKGVEHLDPDDPITTEDPTRKRKDKYDTEDDQVMLARERYKGNLFLVLEYVTHDLTGLMDIQYQFTPVQIKCIFQQLLKALQFMHENKYVHRDIKSSNILLDSHFRLKLADFGLARSLEPPLLDQMEEDGSGSGLQDLTNKVITLWYRPPEVLLGTVNYGCAVDVWSAGCILIELLSGKPLAAGKTELDQLTILAELTGTPDDETWSYLMSLKKSKSLDENIPPVAAELRDSERKPSKLRSRYGPNSKNKARQHIPETALNLLDKLLEWDPRKRLTASFALQNRFFWTQPVPPEDPAELGRIEVAADGHFHEFQTKQRRKEAKLMAEMARDSALLKGDSHDTAGAVFDKTYTDIMKKVAQEGLHAIAPTTVDPTVELSVKPDARAVDDVLKDEKKSRHRSDERDSNHRKSTNDTRDRKHMSHSRENRDRLATADGRDTQDRKSASESDGNRDRSRLTAPEEQNPHRRKHSTGSRGDRERERAHESMVDKNDPRDRDRLAPVDAERTRALSGQPRAEYDSEGDRRRTHERRRERHGEKGDDGSYQSNEKRRHKERRRRSEDETSKETRDKEKKSRKDSSGEADFKGDRFNSPKVDESITSSKEHRSGKRSRRESGGSSSKKDRDRSRGHSDRKPGEKREKERRHKEKRRRHDQDRDRGADNVDSYQRSSDNFGPDRTDSDRQNRGPLRGDDSTGHYGLNGGRMETWDGPRNSGSFRESIHEGRDSGPNRPDRVGPSVPTGYYGPPTRDGPGPAPLFRRGDRDPGPIRNDGPRRSDREGPPHRNEFAPGSRNDRDGPSRHREMGKNGPIPLPFRGDQSIGQWNGRDGPPPHLRHDDFDPRRGREAASRGDYSSGGGPPRGDFGPVGGGGGGGYHQRRDGPPSLQRGSDYDRRGGGPPPRGGGDFGSPPRRGGDDMMRDDPSKRPRPDGRRDRHR